MNKIGNTQSHSDTYTISAATAHCVTICVCVRAWLRATSYIHTYTYKYYNHSITKAIMVAQDQHTQFTFIIVSCQHWILLKVSKREIQKIHTYHSMWDSNFLEKNWKTHKKQQHSNTTYTPKKGTRWRWIPADGIFQIVLIYLRYWHEW